MFKPHLRPGEKPLQVYRRHPITLATKIARAVIFLAVPWYFAIGYGLLMSSNVWVVILLAWTAVILSYLSHIWVIWRLNLYYLTSQRLIHVSHTDVFHKVEVETPLDRILNVSFKTTGFFSSTFRFGDVLVQVVGVKDPLVMKEIGHPEKVKDFIWKMHREVGGEQKLSYSQPEIIPADQEFPYAR